MPAVKGCNFDKSTGQNFKTQTINKPALNYLGAITTPIDNSNPVKSSFASW